MLKIKNSQGVTMLETAVLSTLILIVFSIIFVGTQLTSNKMVLNYAVLTSAREASTSNDYNQAVSRSKSVANTILTHNGIDASGIKVECTNKGGWTKGNNVTITIHSSFRSMFPTYSGNGKFTVGTIPLKSSLTFMISDKK